MVAKHAKFIPMAMMVGSFVSRTARAGRWSQVILNGRKDLRCLAPYFSSVYNPFTFTKYHFLLIYHPHLNITMTLAQNIVMKWFFQIIKWRLTVQLTVLSVPGTLGTPLETGRRGDGDYWINPESNGNPLKVHCDMTTDGGKLLELTSVSSVNIQVQFQKKR